MSDHQSFTSPTGVLLEKTFRRFSISQRWEHLILLLSVGILLITGLPQKYRATEWSQNFLSTPERMDWIRQIHHIAALILTAEVIYHLGKAFILMVRKRLPGDILPNWQDVKDAFQMLKYLLFFSKQKPSFGKYNFEQKVTYWFLFFAIGIMTLTGFIIWFPEFFSLWIPGGVIPAAKLAHSTEAIVAGIFIVIWHFYHVHIERLNLSIFTGRLSENEMKEHHQAEYLRLSAEHEHKDPEGGSQ
jgi:formate dehydrogenase gamma subunit